VGCAAFFRLEAAACELHSVYVRPASRGAGIAGQLVRQLVEQAREAGYRVMRLETATFMEQAQKLYESLGFRVREPYRSIPPQFAPYTIPMELDLGRAGAVPISGGRRPGAMRRGDRADGQPLRHVDGLRVLDRQLEVTDVGFVLFPRCS
jgi:hypothetical protein